MRQAILIACLLIISVTDLAARTLQSYTANYRLYFNDEHVGDAQFSLKLAEDSTYSFEAFTRPAGTMAADNKRHEVLEASSGKITAEATQPAHYYTAVRTDEGTAMLEFFFDWQGMTLTRKDNQEQHKSPLKQHSQDRLSYLLSAMQLAASHRNSISIPLLTETDNRQLNIRKKNRHHMNTSAGRVLAQELEVGYAGKPADRRLWLSVDHGYMPVLLEQTTEQGRVKMELLQIL